MENIIEVKNLTKRYGQHAVLNNANFDLVKGSVTGLLGKNGAGKSTLLKCILGLIKPQSGSIQILGEPAWTLSAEAKARLGYVPQTVQLYPWMKVGQVIPYIASFYPRWNHDLTDRLVKDWGLNPAAIIKPLSPGELQKLLIILALGHEPDLLILDEPAAALDPEARRKFLNSILDLVKDGNRTVLFSTHITSDLERIADRVAILKDGQIVCSDGLDQLKEARNSSLEDIFLEFHR
jgi:ABC-2 type transport system ATP-binding protein